MSYWGKFIGGMSGFAMGGPVGALFGMAVGHAADEGRFPSFSYNFGSGGAFGGNGAFDPLRVASMLGRRDQIFAISVTVLAAKLAKVDGVVSRIEIEAFQRSFSIPPESAAEVGRLFDSARETSAGFEAYATQLGQAFSDERGILEQVLGGLYQIARADGPLNLAESEFLLRVAVGFGLGEAARQRASGGQMPPQQPSEDPYAVLGVSRRAADADIRARWKQLVREHHPDVLASQGASPARIKMASEKVARINAAFDAIKRERRV